MKNPLIKKLKLLETALDLACEALDDHFFYCAAGIYSDTKDTWKERFKREAEEILKAKEQNNE